MARTYMSHNNGLMFVLLCIGSLNLCQSRRVAAAAVTLDLVKIGNRDNAADTTGFGKVLYEFLICKYKLYC